MKMTFTWREDDGEGFMSGADRERLMADPSIAELDFVSDALKLLETLYAEMQLKVLENARLKPSGAEDPTHIH
jgi:hypothetical protein